MPWLRTMYSQLSFRSPLCGVSVYSRNHLMNSSISTICCQAKREHLQGKDVLPESQDQILVRTVLYVPVRSTAELIRHRAVLASVGHEKHEVEKGVSLEPSLDALSLRSDVISSIKILSSLYTQRRSLLAMFYCFRVAHRPFSGQRGHLIIVTSQ